MLLQSPQLLLERLHNLFTHFLIIDNLSLLDFTFINDYAMNIFLHIAFVFFQVN